MSKVLTVACNIRRLSEVNVVLSARGYVVRGAETRSKMRHLLSSEPFQHVLLLDELPPIFADALHSELHAGRMSPHIVHAEMLEKEEIVELLVQTGTVSLAA